MNREGDLAEGQKKRLTRSFLREMLVGGGFAIALVGLAYVVPPKVIKGLEMEIPLVLAFLFIGLGWICVRSHRKTLASSHVVAFTGHIKKHNSPNESTLILTREDDQTERLFAVDQAVYNAFVEGESYRLYCPSFSETTLLSAEPVFAESKRSL